MPTRANGSKASKWREITWRATADGMRCEAVLTIPFAAIEYEGPAEIKEQARRENKALREQSAAGIAGLRRLAGRIVLGR